MAPEASPGEARQYQGELPSQFPPLGSQGPHWVPEAQPPAATPFVGDQHSPPMLTWPAEGALVVVVGGEDLVVVFGGGVDLVVVGGGDLVVVVGGDLVVVGGGKLVVVGGGNLVVVGGDLVGGGGEDLVGTSVVVSKSEQISS